MSKNVQDSDGKASRMFCPRCGQPIKEGHPFCSSCGYKIGAPRQAQGGAQNQAREFSPAASPNQPGQPHNAGQMGQQAGQPYNAGQAGQQYNAGQAGQQYNAGQAYPPEQYYGPDQPYAPGPYGGPDQQYQPDQYYGAGQQYAPDPQYQNSQPYDSQYSGGQPRKRRPRWALRIGIVVLLLVALVFAGTAIGIIPRFWKVFFPSGDKEATEKTWSAREGEGVTVPNEKFEGLGENSVRTTLENAGFNADAIKIEERYSFDVYGDDERDGLVDRVCIETAEGPELEAGETFKSDTPIVIVTLIAPSDSDMQNRTNDETNLEKRLKDDPKWFEGSWVGYELVTFNDDASWNNAKCNAGSDSSYFPRLEISNPNATSLTANVSAQALMHYHSNDQPRSYDSTVDQYEDIGRLAGESTFVMGYDTGKDGLYQGFDDIVYREGEDEVPHKVAITLEFCTRDMDMGDTLEEKADFMEDLLDDDFSKEFESIDEAMDAYGKALNDKHKVGFAVHILQSHNYSNIGETYMLERASETQSET